MWKFIKQLFCHHDFECTHDVMTAYAEPEFTCRKCGRVEGL